MARSTPNHKIWSKRTTQRLRFTGATYFTFFTENLEPNRSHKNESVPLAAESTAVSTAVTPPSCFSELLSYGAAIARSVCMYDSNYDKTTQTQGCLFPWLPW